MMMMTCPCAHRLTDSQGQCANDVESEQVVEVDGQYTSYVQVTVQLADWLSACTRRVMCAHSIWPG